MEFENAFKLDHPSIMKVFELFVEEKRGRLYLIMEYIKHKSLGKMLRERGKMKGGFIIRFLIKFIFKIYHVEKEVIGIIQKLLDGVSYMHSKGICHRDITPNNILVSKGLKYKIISNIEKF